MVQNVSSSAGRDADPSVGSSSHSHPVLRSLHTLVRHSSCQTLVLTDTLPPMFRLTLILVTVLSVLPSLAQRRRSKPPIVGEAAKNVIQARGTQCNFGNETFEIDDKWKPNLGPPVGVLSCVRCECVAANRKSRLVTRVKCRNIRHDCPKPSCDHPVILPDRCCKTCPGEEDSVLEDDLIGRKISRKGEQGRKIYSLVSPSKSTSGTPRPAHESRERKVPVIAGVAMDDQETNDVTSTHKCYYEGNIFEDGSQWRAQHQDCQMCSCQVSPTHVPLLD